ncbi:MAG: lytic transglycosylase domain-containing protein [Rhodocyclaceae bacterium]|nr:lytic transglycosylase domain-containing protein [Rhodocyclaceae bacterium]
MWLVCVRFCSKKLAEFFTIPNTTLPLTGRETSLSVLRTVATALLLGCVCTAHAGNQQYEPLAASVQAALSAAIADKAAPNPHFSSVQEKLDWVNWQTEMSVRLAKRMPDRDTRLDFLRTVFYEAKRAGLDPQMVLGLIQVESGFHKYAVSKAGARGYMQVMPFWKKLIGNGDQNLFLMRNNLRFGCTILRHYLDIEKGDLYRALGRYNGSLGKPEYPNMVRGAWEKHWAWSANVAR